MVEWDYETVDIMEFCYGKKFLNLKAKKITLYPLQEAILKSFYDGEKYNELFLALGRRSGKDLLCCIIALYEVYRLLNAYKNSDLDHVANSYTSVLLIGNSVAQTKILEDALNDLLEKIPWVGFCLRPNKEKYYYSFKEYKKEAFLRCVHSHSDYFDSPDYCPVVIFNEFASFNNQHQLLSKISPVTKVFPKKYSKIINISSPRAGSIFNELCLQKHSNRLVFNFPTWMINTTNTYDEIKDSFYIGGSDEAFDEEFGANLNVIPRKKTEQVTLRIDSDLINMLKKQAGEISIKENREVSYTDLIRQKIEAR